MRTMIKRLAIATSTAALTAAGWGLSAASAATCVAGSWTTVDTPNAHPIQYQTAHFAFRWNPGDVTQTQATDAGKQLELTWSKFIDTIGFQPPSCSSATKYKVNINIDPTFGLSGGIDDNGNPGMWIGPDGLSDHFGLAHEFTHALQGGTGGLQESPYSGWIWEDHANFMASQLDEYRNFAHCSIFLKDYPHLYLGSSRTRYCTFQFLQYIKEKYGYSAINDMWSKAPKAGDAAQATADPLFVLASNLGWNLTKMNDVWGDWAMHNVNWDYIDADGYNLGQVYRDAYGGYDQSTGETILSAVVLDPIDAANRRYAVPFYWAPQRWGYNIVKLYPDAGATSVTVTFRGVTQSKSATATLPGLANEPSSVGSPGSDWRWGVVAIGSDGTSRYSALQKGSDGAVTVTVKSGDKGLYMMVMGTSTVAQHIQFDQPYYSIYRYPYMVQFTNAQPEGAQAGYVGISGGHKFANGGGWVGPNASVASTAYVGPYARVISGTVSGNARIQEHGVVLDNAQVSGNAVIGGNTVLRGNTVVKDSAQAKTSMLGLGEYEQNIVLSGTAQHIGDVEQRGASFSKGVYYGFVDQAASTDPSRGSNLTAPVPEVTAAPNYTWRK